MSPMNVKTLAALLLLAGCASANIAPDPDAKGLPSGPDAGVTSADAGPPPSNPSPSQTGVDPVQLEVREVSCDSTLNNEAGTVTFRAAIASYPGLTKYQILDSVHVMLTGGAGGQPSGYDIATTPFVKDGSASVTCGTTSTPAPSYKVTFVRRL